MKPKRATTTKGNDTAVTFPASMMRYFCRTCNKSFASRLYYATHIERHKEQERRERREKQS